ncbi:hypothetical protein C2845_PM07G02710 [Panicum miliaceum]|uniref:RING-type E3 ubiquitin transferase n=1 Tax=Panicum miliaceum TaxID=4540 RepID=A0A3L6SMJ7_PANMI|nr:hypothetical protein C2845_PM07G02710 [Panicum miliaceum]
MSDSIPGKRRAEPQQEESCRKRKDGSPTSVTVELEVLDCPVCYEPLRPPIFQCAVGHLICSSCCGKLPRPKKCHHCSCESDYNRCHGIEKIIGSIQVPCSNTKYGCSMKTSYYEREDHETTCPRAPCFCPDTSCSFSGSTGMLQEHFIDEHQWRSTKFRYGWSFYTNIQEGIHVISGEDEHLFLLNVVSEPFGCVISVFYVRPHDTDLKFRCALSVNFWKGYLRHSQYSEFQVPSTTLSDGLPRDCFLFIVPKFYLDEDSKICVIIRKA